MVLVLATLVSIVGLIDSVVGGTWDFVVVFGLAVALQALLLLRTLTGRTAVTLRRDLADWAADQAVATGESADEVVDRCVSTVRANLVDRPVP